MNQSTLLSSFGVLLNFLKCKGCDDCFRSGPHEDCTPSALFKKVHCSQLKFSMRLKYPDLWHFFFFRLTHRSFPSFLLGIKSPSNTSLFHTASQLSTHENSIRIHQYTVIHLYTVLPTFETKQQAKNYRNHWKMSLEINNVC